MGDDAPDLTAGSRVDAQPELDLFAFTHRRRGACHADDRQSRRIGAVVVVAPAVIVAVEGDVPNMLPVSVTRSVATRSAAGAGVARTVISTSSPSVTCSAPAAIVTTGPSLSLTATAAESGLPTVP